MNWIRLFFITWIILLCLVVVGVVSMLLTVIWSEIPTPQHILRDACLAEIARDYCAENNLMFDWERYPEFTCVRDRRSNPETFNFYPEDLEKCRKV